MSETVSKLSLDTSNYRAGWQLHVIIACLFSGSFLIALDTNIINVALPRISSDFHSLQDVAWYGSAYLVAITAFQPIYGSWYRFFRTDVVYRFSIAIFEIGSIICAAAVDSNMFIAGRAVAGFGAAGVLQGALSIISQVVPLEKRPLYMAVVISVFVITVTVGPVLGGALTQKATWRWCFWINLPMGAAVLVGTSVFLRLNNAQSKARSQTWRKKLENMDPLGCVLFIATVVCLILALHWAGQTKPWNSPPVIGCLVGAFLLACLFVAWQRKANEQALLPPRVFCQRSIWTSAAVLFLLGAQIYSVVFFLPFWFQGVKSVDPVTTGVNFIPLLLSQLVVLVLTGAVVKHWGHYVPLMVVGELIAVAGQVLLAHLAPTSQTIFWAAAMVVTGAGTGMAMQLPYTAIAVVLEDADIPVGNAIAVLAYQLGGAISISAGQTIIVTTLLDLVPQMAPPLSGASVIKAGAAKLDSLSTNPHTLAALKSLWNTAVTRTMYIGVAVLAASVPFTFAMQWLNAVKVAKARKERSQMLEPSEPEISEAVTELQEQKRD